MEKQYKDHSKTLTAFIEGKSAHERYGVQYQEYNRYKGTPQNLSFIKGAIHSLRTQEGYQDVTIYY